MSFLREVTHVRAKRNAHEMLVKFKRWKLILCPTGTGIQMCSQPPSLPPHQPRENARRSGRPGHRPAPLPRSRAGTAPKQASPKPRRAPVTVPVRIPSHRDPGARRNAPAPGGRHGRVPDTGERRLRAPPAGSAEAAALPRGTAPPARPGPLRPEAARGRRQPATGRPVLAPGGGGG